MKNRLFAGTIIAASLTGLAASAAMAAGVEVTVFNSKMEIQSQLEEMAEEYSASHDVDLKVYYSSDTVAAHMSTRYASNSPYTISMVDAKDIYSLAPDHGLDLSDQDWVNDTTQAIEIDGAVYGFPVCVEARGLIYNKTAIEDTLGEEFNPEDYKTYDAFAELLAKLAENGMEKPVGILKEDWSLAAHYLCSVYEERDDVDAFVDSLYAGEVDLMEDERFNSRMDTFDLLMQYNYADDAPVAAVREDTELFLAEGEIAFMYGGNWDWSVLNEYEPEGEMGQMAVPQNDEPYNDMMIGGGSKYFFIDNSDNTSEEQRQAAKDFLNWLVYEQEGQEFLVNTCALVPAYSNIDLEVSDPLGACVKAYADSDRLLPSFNYAPDDHYAKVGAFMQEYLAGDIDRAAFAADIQDYWASTTPVEH